MVRRPCRTWVGQGGSCSADAHSKATSGPTILESQCVREGADRGACVAVVCGALRCAASVRRASGCEARAGGRWVWMRLEAGGSPWAHILYTHSGGLRRDGLEAMAARCWPAQDGAGWVQAGAGAAHGRAATGGRWMLDAGLASAPTQRGFWLASTPHLEQGRAAVRQTRATTQTRQSRPEPPRPPPATAPWLHPRVGRCIPG